MLSQFDFQPYFASNLIRRGAKNDGGYLIPKDTKADLLISLGLGDDWKFELDLVKYHHVRSFVVFDHTQNAKVYVKRLLKLPKINDFNLNAYIYRLIVLLRYLRDFVIKSNTHVKKRITNKDSASKNNLFKEFKNDIDLHEIFDEFVSSPDISVILKIDVEGSEYEIIHQILDHSVQISLLIIEFHNINTSINKFENCLSLLKTKFFLIHSHINNYGHMDEYSIPQFCEFTFIHKTQFNESIKVDKLPRAGLDAPSCPSRPDFKLYFT